MHFGVSKWQWKIRFGTHIFFVNHESHRTWFGQMWLVSSCPDANQMAFIQCRNMEKKNHSFAGSISRVCTLTFLTDADVSADGISVSGEPLCGRGAHPPSLPPRDNCFDLCSEEIRQPVPDVTSWHVTWIQANKRAEGKNIRGTFQAFPESFQMEQWLCPGGKKWSCWYVYIRQKGSRHCHHQQFSLSLQDFQNSLYLKSNSSYAEVSCPGWCV